MTVACGGAWALIAALSSILAASIAQAEDGFRLPLERLRLPAGFAIETWARVPSARSLAVTDDGAKVYVGTNESKVFAILDPDRDGLADEVVTVASGLAAPNGVALGPDGDLFIAERHRIIRLDSGDRGQIVVPAGVLPEDARHGWRYAGFGPDGRLYVSIGAPCNVCEPRSLEGTIVRMRPDGHELRIFARGIRNSLGFDWHPASGQMFFTDNGADHMGDLMPRDELNHAPRPGLHFGFPYAYAPGAPYPEFEDRVAPQGLSHPFLEFEAHAAPLGIDFYSSSMFPAEYRHDAFIAQHGSWNRSQPVGYRIVRVRFEGGLPVDHEVFVDGWLGSDGVFFGRPVDLEELPDGSLLVSDDFAGVIYRITYRPAADGREVAGSVSRTR